MGKASGSSFGLGSSVAMNTSMGFKIRWGLEGVGEPEQELVDIASRSPASDAIIAVYVSALVWITVSPWKIVCNERFIEDIITDIFCFVNSN